MKVTLLMAVTLDGKIAKDPQHFPDWTGKADKKFFMDYTKKSKCLIMGHSTFKTIGRPLPERKNIILTRTPKPSEQDNLEFCSDSPEVLLKRLKDEGFEEVVVAGGSQINTLFAPFLTSIILTISPLVFGRGMDLFSESISLNLEIGSLTRLDENLICVHYKVIK